METEDVGTACSARDRELIWCIHWSVFMKNIAVCFVILFVSCFGCKTDFGEKKTATMADETLFIDTVLNQHFRALLQHDYMLIIIENLCRVTEQEAKERCNENWGNDKIDEALRDYCRKNAKNEKIYSLGKLSVKHKVITEQEWDVIFSGKDNWKVFYKRYPKALGLVSISRPGFCIDGTFAVIYVGTGMGNTCGRGELLIYQKKDGKWIFVDLAFLSVS